MFYDNDTKEIVTPYSTASVESFCESILTTVEQKEYEKLYSHASQRIKSLITALSKEHAQLGSASSEHESALQMVINAANANYAVWLKSSMKCNSL